MSGLPTVDYMQFVDMKREYPVPRKQPEKHMEQVFHLRFEEKAHDSSLKQLSWTTLRRRSAGEPVSAVGTNSLCGLTSGGDPGKATYAVLERRLQKAITANTKWQQKYEIETKVSPRVCCSRYL